MFDQTYKVTLQRQMALLSYMLTIHAIVIFFFLYINGFQLYLPMVIGYLCIFMFDALPTIILHLQYLSVNRDAVLVVRTDQRNLSFTKKGEHLNYSFDDIEQIIYVFGYGGGAWYSFSEYRYFVLVFKDGKKVMISCLMLKCNRPIIEAMFGMQVKGKGGFFPWVRKGIVS